MSRTLSPDRSSYRRSPSIPIRLLRWIVKLRLFWLILIAFLFLSGCVRYEVGINFTDANHGAIVQQVELSRQLTGVSRATANLWLDQLAAQAEELGGQVKHPSDRSLWLKIPFYNAKDLVAKFDHFFQALTNTGLVTAAPAPLSQLQIKTNNYVLWQRHYLIYDLDLRSLRLIPDAEDAAALLINPKDLLNLEFTLNASGVQRLENSLAVSSPSRHQVWKLQPGEMNHLEASFWVFSPIGIGFVVIVLLVGGGMFYQAWRDPSGLIDLPPESS